jgi:hypothetical protein
VSVTALVLIMIAALGHATWNLFSKQASAAGAMLAALAGIVLLGERPSRRRRSCRATRRSR